MVIAVGNWGERWVGAVSWVGASTCVASTAALVALAVLLVVAGIALTADVGTGDSLAAVNWGVNWVGALFD